MGDVQLNNRQPNGRIHLHLRPNMLVEALFEDFLKPQNNAFFDGVLLREVSDGVYHVKFLDGDEDECCPEWKLRPINVVQFGLLPNGCDVRALWTGDHMYYDAKVARANADSRTYDVQFNDDGVLATEVPVEHLRYSSAFAKLDDVQLNMIVLVQWTLTMFAPGRVVGKNSADNTCHVRNQDYEIKHCNLAQLSRVYGYVPPRVLGEPETICGKCGQQDGNLRVCDWCQSAYHSHCDTAAVSVSSPWVASPWYCSRCLSLDKSKPRRQELPPLSSIYHQAYSIAETIAAPAKRGRRRKSKNIVTGRGVRGRRAAVKRDEAPADMGGPFKRSRPSTRANQ